MKNYMQLSGFSIFCIRYVFVDTAEQLYKRLFAGNGVRLKSVREYVKNGSELRIVICKIMKADKEQFEDLVKQIRNDALILGHKDYDAMCRLLSNIEQGHGLAAE